MTGSGDGMDVLLDAGEPWCILRMAGPRTLKVVESLRRAGYEIWTPATKRRRSLPRSTKYRDVEIAALPTFAFARYRDVADLNEITLAPHSDHPTFSILRHRGTFARVEDAALYPLREYQADLDARWEAFTKSDRLSKKKRSGRAARYVMGQRVHLPDTAFHGLAGHVVEVRRNGDLIIVFESGGKATVNPCFVEPVHVGSGSPEQGNAARAA